MNSNYPLPYLMLHRFCLQILPKIHDKIKWLNLESLSMKRILLPTNYSNLYELGLYDLEIERVKNLIITSFSFVKKLAEIIKYSHLTQLDLFQAHKYYLEQVLLDTKTCLPNNFHHHIDYRPLKKVSHNLIRDATRINCSKVCIAYENHITRLRKHFKYYFLHTYLRFP
ncbi:unnamed protein product [Rotaria sp. Silwood2]|nr:unnamed protein product [Rotaria sp. Silwood2]CAF4557259.1 unnamed protein product [Rotaria sp. Silwood2]